VDRAGGGLPGAAAEFAKVALVVGMAMLLAEKRDGEDGPRDSDVLLVLALAAVPLALILLQPDLGHGARARRRSCSGVLAVGRRPKRWLAGCARRRGRVRRRVQLGVLDDYQVARFAAFANPELDPRGVGYNTNQARIAIGSAGLTGKGLFEGTQTTAVHPEQQTDFVFTVARGGARAARRAR
jgi:rod shape determining protein RodA